jgi:hypothetical protein
MKMTTEPAPEPATETITEPVADSDANEPTPALKVNTTGVIVAYMAASLLAVIAAFAAAGSIAGGFHPTTDNRGEFVFIGVIFTALFAFLSWIAYEIGDENAKKAARRRHFIDMIERRGYRFLSDTPVKLGTILTVRDPDDQNVRVIITDTDGLELVRLTRVSRTKNHWPGLPA